MSKEPKPYTAIPDYFEKSPQELSAPGQPMEFSAEWTSFVRKATGLFVKRFIINEDETNRYQEAGTCLVTPSHRNFLDMTALAELAEVSGEGQAFFMSKRENMDNWLTARIFAPMRTFPIDRDMTDPRWATAFIRWGRFAMGTDIENGEQDRKLVMFPEGTRKEGDLIEDLLPGTLILARKLKVPVLPIGIANQREKWSLRPTVLVAVGEPFLPGRGDLDLLAEKMQEQYDRANYELQTLIEA